jgi:hypothetical protein
MLNTKVALCNALRITMSALTHHLQAHAKVATGWILESMMHCLAANILYLVKGMQDYLELDISSLTAVQQSAQLAAEG